MVFFQSGTSTCTTTNSMRYSSTISWRSFSIFSVEDNVNPVSSYPPELRSKRILEELDRSHCHPKVKSSIKVWLEILI